MQTLLYFKSFSKSNQKIIYLSLKALTLLTDTFQEIISRLKIAFHFNYNDENMSGAQTFVYIPNIEIFSTITYLLSRTISGEVSLQNRFSISGLIDMIKYHIYLGFA